MKNFMSTGAVTQAIDFDRTDLTLVLGENLDLGGDGAKNGVGKSSALQALSYALFGAAMNGIKKDNLCNRTNGKQMLVTLDFEVSGTNYRIVRGRKPAVLKFFINDQEQEAKDDSQGDSRETQDSIERILGMSHDMFKHIVALNTYTEPFLALKANDQRIIIEQLLGITILSEKADAVKTLIKSNKELIQQEDYRIKAVEEANKRIQEQIENLRRRSSMWSSKQQADVLSLSEAIDKLNHIDIDAEIQQHDALVEWNNLSTVLQGLGDAKRRAESDIARERKSETKLLKDIAALESHTCHACGQAFHDDKHEQVLQSKKADLAEAVAAIAENQTVLEEVVKAIAEAGVLGDKPQTFYPSKDDALNHKSQIATLEAQLTAKASEEDPYAPQIADMEDQALQTVSFDEINRLSRLQKHQEFLLDMLTKKDSFVRKQIINQNLSYLNARLTSYLNKLGLPHEVVFKNDLSVEITELGREMDFGNLSRGEATRVSLGLSFAFRDVWESMYTPINLMFVDELLDGGLDTKGVEDSVGLLKTMGRERQKSVWLISHREELISRVPNILKVVKEGGYTRYEPVEAT